MCKCRINWEYLTSARLAALCVGALMFWTFLFAVAAPTSVEVFAPRHRLADELAPVLRPLVGADGSVGTLGGQLVVRGTPAQLVEVRRTLDAIDRPARQLRVTVAQRSDSALGAGGGALTGAAGPEGARVQARVWDSRSLDNAQVLQSVQVLDGRSAFVILGDSRAVPQRQVVRTFVGGRLVEQVVSGGVDYRTAETGFYVLPRVAGERVTVEITPQRESFVPGAPASIESQRVSTVLSGTLGEWLPVAGTLEERGSRGEVILGRAGARAAQERAIFLRVEEVR